MATDSAASEPSGSAPRRPMTPGGIHAGTAVMNAGTPAEYTPGGAARRVPTYGEEAYALAGTQPMVSAHAWNRLVNELTTLSGPGPGRT